MPQMVCCCRRENADDSRTLTQIVAGGAESRTTAAGSEGLRSCDDPRRVDQLCGRPQDTLHREPASATTP